MSTRRASPPTAWHAAFSGALLTALTLLAPTSARAVFECDAAALCPSSPCTINGVHYLEEGCFLDFSGKDVTVGPAAALISTHPFGSISITARNLVVQGKIDGSGAIIDLTTTESFATQKIGAGPGIVQSRLLAYAESGILVYVDAAVYIVAGGSVSLQGAGMSVSGATGFLVVEGTEILVDSRLTANQYTEHGWIYLTATSGSIHTTSKITSVGRLPGISGGLVFDAAGDIVVDGPLEGNGANITLLAGGNISILDKVKNDTKGSAAPVVEALAGGDVLIQGRVQARGLGAKAASGGEVLISGGSNGTVQINSRIDVRGPTAAGGIQIADACSVVVEGHLDARTKDGTGSIRVRSRSTLDLALAKLRTSSGGSNVGECRCLDLDTNLVCDGGCVVAPQAPLIAPEPPFTVVPTVLPACS